MSEARQSRTARRDLLRIRREVRAGDRHLSYRDLSALSFFEAEELVSAYVERLRRLQPEERIRLYRRPGGMSSWERWIWAARWPEEIPLINGEFEWIARTLADNE